jgi:hypothetical protein
MDRFDERKHDRSDADDTTPADNTPAREGDVLGLGGAPVPKMPGDPTTEYDDESVAQRRTRALEGEAEDTAPVEDTRSGPGATGIDMGSGGRGTDVSGR